jgi:2,3-dihydro-2,3-dihydroxybenzoate dehydrogenase
MTSFSANALDGQVALIVGCGKSDGIGLACAKHYAAAGARVAMADIDVEGVRRNRAALPADAAVTTHAVDVTDAASVAALIADVAREHGRIDTVVNTVGILIVQSVLDLDPDSWDRTFAVNTRGQMLVAQAAARYMISAGIAGSLILMASNVGRVPRVNNAAYASSKAAVIHLARALALELGKHGISANSVCPGSTATSMLLDNQTSGDSARLDGIVKGSIAEWRTGIPLGRLATVDDQAAACVFLSSPAGRFISGQTICVDGAQTYF